MIRRFDRFTQAFEESQIPFLLVEVITNGCGQMTDLVCRYGNSAAADLLHLPVAQLVNRRYVDFGQGAPPDAFSPMTQVAFHGSAASFLFETRGKQKIDVTCYQPVYGLCACILEEVCPALGQQQATAPDPTELADGAAVLEVGRSGTRMLSCTERLCALAGYSRREFVAQFFNDFSRLVQPEDWPGLLQALLDGARASCSIRHSFRLLRHKNRPLWVEVRGRALLSRQGVCVFQTLLLDVDTAHRSQEQLKTTTRELASSQDQFRQLFDHMPGGYCLFQVSADGQQPVLLRVSRGFRDLLGYTESELLRRISADPLWHICPNDQETVRQALAAVVENHTAPQCSFRMQRKDGQTIWLSLSITPRKQRGGSILLYAAYTDITRQKTAEAELRFHSELCDLLLQRAGSLRMDYEPHSDTATIEQYDACGKLYTRACPGYLSTLPTSSTLHSEDRVSVAQRLSEALTKPQKGSFFYRANYDGQSFRWYQASFVTLADARGDVCRLLAKAEDVSERKAAEERFHLQSQRRKQLSPGTLAFFRLDLTADRILDIRSASRPVLRLLFANSAQGCLSCVAERIPLTAQRKRFFSTFSRDALLEAYLAGRNHRSVPHLFQDLEGPPQDLRTAIELVENPENRHVEAFCYLGRSDSQSPLL